MKEPTIAWCTDLHLELREGIGEARIKRFFQEIDDASADAVVVSGDFGILDHLDYYLKNYIQHIRTKIYFVLGNHDFHGRSIAQTREMAVNLTHSHHPLEWLPESGIVPLSQDWALVGHDGWGDGRYGNVLESNFVPNDYLLIQDLASLFNIGGKADKVGLVQAIKQQGEIAARHFKEVLPKAFETHQNVLAITHVPPFSEASLLNGKAADPNSETFPHFACKAVGDAFLEVLSKHPKNNLLVLCGHTHNEGSVEVRPNMKVYVGKATYNEPQIGMLFQL